METVTAVILTYNEEPNIGRVLESLSWCERIVVLDSGSTDQTKSVALGFTAVSWYTRGFDNHASQWRFAITETGIDTDLVLALDSDMIVPAEFVSELNRSFTSQHVGGILTFRYSSLGYLLNGSLYPAQLRLLRLHRFSVVQLGHTQKFIADGPLYTFRTPCLHDDRKSADSWLRAQLNYSKLEYRRIVSSNSVTLKDRLRSAGLMPFIAGAYGYFRAGGPFLGRAALNYGLERMSFEAMLTLRLLRRHSGPNVDLNK